MDISKEEIQLLKKIREYGISAEVLSREEKEILQILILKGYIRVEKPVLSGWYYYTLTTSGHEMLEQQQSGLKSTLLSSCDFLDKEEENEDFENSSKNIDILEKNESIAIDVTQRYENEIVKEMEMFGWKIQNHQEIHKKGKAYGRTINIYNQNHVIKTKVSKHIRLHFHRSLELPNIDKIRRIESAIFALPFPEPPTEKSFLWPILFACIGGLILLANPNSAKNIFGIIVIVGWSIWWFYSKVKRQDEMLEICEQSINRKLELIRQLETLKAK